MLMVFRDKKMIFVDDNSINGTCRRRLLAGWQIKVCCRIVIVFWYEVFIVSRWGRLTAPCSCCRRGRWYTWTNAVIIYLHVICMKQFYQSSTVLQQNVVQQRRRRRTTTTTTTTTTMTTTTTTTGTTTTITKTMTMTTLTTTTTITTSTMTMTMTMTYDNK